MAKLQPSLVSSLLAVGTALTGAILASQAQQTDILYACGLSALFAAASILFSKGEAEKARKEAV